MINNKNVIVNKNTIKINSEYAQICLCNMHKILITHYAKHEFCE